MKAVRIFEHGNHDVLIVDEIARPECNDNSALVEIKACSLNHLDIWVRNGLPGIPINLPLIMGSDAAGTITQCGKNIKGFKVGDDIVVQPGTFDLSNEKQTISKENYSPGYGIIGETSDGVQTEYVNLGQNNIYKKPEHLTYEEAASMQLVFMTSYQMIVKRAKLTCDEKILIYGGTSGVGSAAIQIAKDIGATVVATVGDRKKENFAYDVGADYVFIHDNSLKDNILKTFNKDKIDVIFEHIGAATWDQSLSLLNIGGRIVTCGATTGAKVSLDLRYLFMKQQSILGSTMGDIDTFTKVMTKISKKQYKPFIDKVFSFNEIKAAHMHLENRNQFGKIILVP